MFPQVTREMVEGFAKHWNFNGITLVLDSATKQFAMDFTNIALRSYHEELVAGAIAKQKAKEAATAQGTPAMTNAATSVVPPAAPSIILTD